jgi:hypothetical protein
VMVARVFNRSLVDRASRSSALTVSTSRASKLAEQPAKLGPSIPAHTHRSWVAL